MDALYKPEPLFTPADGFACLYAQLATFGADLRGYNSLRPSGKSHPPRQDPLTMRQLRAELAAVDTLAVLLRDTAEEYVCEPEQSFDRRLARKLLADICVTAADCKVCLQGHIDRLKSTSQSEALVLASTNWVRLQVRLMAPWS